MRAKKIFTLLSLFCGGLALALADSALPQPTVEAVEKAGKRIAAETAADIKALGTKPATSQIASIVFKAVRTSPDSVLRIVDASVRVSPRPAVPAIVTAATSALPDRWKQVTYRRLLGDVGGKNPAVSIGFTDSRTSSPATGDPGTSSASGIPMTLAEAVARTAFDADPSLSYSEVQAAVNAAVLADADKLQHYLESPRAASGVGDAGLSNYANEPFRTPAQPAVSR